MEQIKWKFYLRWQYLKYRIKTNKLQRKIWWVRKKTEVMKYLTRQLQDE